MIVTIVGLRVRRFLIAAAEQQICGSSAVTLPVRMVICSCVMLTNRITIRYDPKNIMLKVLVGRIHVFGYTATEVK